MAQELRVRFVQISAVTLGIKEVKTVMEEARSRGHTLSRATSFWWELPQKILLLNSTMPFSLVCAS